MRAGSRSDLGVRCDHGQARRRVSCASVTLSTRPSRHRPRARRPSSGYLLPMGVSVQVWLAPAGAEPRSAAHRLLLELADTLGSQPVLSHDPDGRPVIPGLAVSITHTHHLVAVATSRTGPLGLDVEELYPRAVGPLARRWFTPRELAWMEQKPEELTAFLQLWTAKEAVGTALGRGLHQSGLRRPMPLPDTSAVAVPARQARPGSEDGTERHALHAGVVSGEAGLAVLHGPAEQAVLAVAAPLSITELVVTMHHDTTSGIVVRSRTSTPVVVRGN